MDFLSPWHLSQVVSASQHSREDTVAEFAWLMGREELYRAMEAIASGADARRHLVAAAERLEESLVRDPGMADAWLTLFILESLRPVPLERYQAIIAALAACAERLGEQQAALGLELNAYYVPLLATRVPVATPTDARLLYVGHLTGDHQHEEAEEWLERCDPELAQAIAAQAHLLLHQGEYADATDLFELLATDPRFRVEGHLGGGLALAGMGLWDTAAEEIEEALALADSRRLRLVARYVLAGVLANLDERAERQELERIYAEDPAFADVAFRLGRPKGAITFEDIVSLFNASIPEVGHEADPENT
jgi:tetratricopeptide (TPR) repeat protein